MKKIVFIPMTLALLTLAVPSFAAKQGPCSADAQKLCPGLSWSSGLGKCCRIISPTFRTHAKPDSRRGIKDGVGSSRRPVGRTSSNTAAP